VNIGGAQQKMSCCMLKVVGMIVKEWYVEDLMGVVVAGLG
jgi:hypothetical protein